MKKRPLILGLSLSIIFGGIIGFHLFKNYMIQRYFATFEPPPVSVASVKAVKKDWQPRINAVGHFVATKGVEVNSQASGKVVKIHFDSGEYAKEDSPLIDIDDSIEQATLRFNQADMVLKKINYQRQLDLLKHAATPNSSVDEAKANLDQAKANIDKILAQIKQKHITAPFDGRLGIRQINLGQYISPGQTSIVSLQALDPLYLEFNLPEQELKLLHAPQPIEFSVEAYPNKLFSGEITALNSKIDPNTHTILVQATIPNCSIADFKNDFSVNLFIENQAKQTQRVQCNTEANKRRNIKDFAFIPGMFAAVSVKLPSIPNTVVLPSTAISYSLYGDSVFLLEKTPKKDAEDHPIYTAKRVFITTGEEEGNDTVIQSGVHPGDLIVSSGELKLQNNTTVVINNDISLNTTLNPEQLGH